MPAIIAVSDLKERGLVKYFRYTLANTVAVLAALAVLCLLPSLAAAQSKAPATDSHPPVLRPLTLTNTASTYNLTTNIRIFEDRGKNLTFQKVLSQHQTGAGRSPSGNKIFLDYTSPAYWLVFTMDNQAAAKDRWILDLGTRDNDTVGTADRLALFSDANPDLPLMIDGRNVNNKVQAQGQDKNAIPFTLEPEKTRTFALYIEPTHGMPLIMTPQIEEPANYRAIRDDLNLESEALVGLLIIFMGVSLLFFLRYKHPICLLLMAYIAAQFMIYWNTDEIVSLGNNTGIVYLDVLYAIAAMSALMLTQQVFFAGAEKAKFWLSHLIPTTTAVIALVTAIGLASDTAADITTPLLLRFIPVILPAFIVALAFLTILQRDVPRKMMYTLAWLVLSVAGVASETGMSLLKAVSAIGPNFYWFCFVPHVLLLSFSALSFISISDKRRKQREQEEAIQRENEMEFHKTRELSDQSRLLGVLQREKELITDLRNREAERIQALRQAKEIAEEANKAKSEFLAIISHEIRTPMTGIMGMIRILIDTPLNDKQKEYTSTLQYAGETLLALLNDILDFSKASAGKIELERVNFDLGRLVESVIVLMSGRADEKKIYLKAEIAPQTPLLLKGDPTRLRQILLNLVTNAVKFTEKGSVTLVINLRESAASKRHIYFAIKDSGIGIPKEARKNLFTPYTQANASISRRFGGTGLGLSICQRLVTAMGGEIDVESEPGVGTTFSFVLPFEEGTAETKAEATTRPVTRPLQILIVDDNPINLQVVSGLLEKDSHKTVAISKAKEAMDELKKKPFDVVLMDMEMPEINGLEATRMIRAWSDREKSAVPIIAMTANTLKEDIYQCLKAGMNDYCSKPIDLERLRALLQQVANKEGSFKISAKSSSSSSPKPTLPATPSPPPTPKDSFSADVLNSLKKSMGAAELDNLMIDLYKKTEELIAAAEKAVEEKNVKALAGRGHDIYGMTANFGLTAISELAHKLDRQAKEMTPIEKLAEIVVQLRPTYEATRAAITLWNKA